MIYASLIQWRRGEVLAGGDIFKNEESFKNRLESKKWIYQYTSNRKIT